MDVVYIYTFLERRTGERLHFSRWNIYDRWKGEEEEQGKERGILQCLPRAFDSSLFLPLCGGWWKKEVGNRSAGLKSELISLNTKPIETKKKREVFTAWKKESYWEGGRVSFDFVIQCFPRDFVGWCLIIGEALTVVTCTSWWFPRWIDMWAGVLGGPLRVLFEWLSYAHFFILLLLAFYWFRSPFFSQKKMSICTFEWWGKWQWSFLFDGLF